MCRIGRNSAFRPFLAALLMSKRVKLGFLATGSLLL